MKPTIIAHGGAWYWNDALDKPKKQNMEKACAIGLQILTKGGTALDAVQQTVVALENDPLFDAGTGGYLNQDGLVQLDALIVDGSQINFGAVAGVTRIKNPINLARVIMDKTPHCLFVGEGAERLAFKVGMGLIDNEVLQTPDMIDHFTVGKNEGLMDTVGAIAIDRYGNTATATSTSGSPYKPSGRVGDSPLFGSGGYAKDGVGCAVSTGYGENIMRLLLSKYTWDRMAAGMKAQEAAYRAIAYAEKQFKNSMVGVLAIDANGNMGVAHTTHKIALAWSEQNGVIQSAIHYPGH